MRKDLIFCIIGLLSATMLMMLVTPAFAWYYNSYPSAPAADTKYEQFGPRVDRMLIKLYSAAEGEWDAVKAGQLDIGDWPLTQPYYNDFLSPTYVGKDNVVSIGGEFGVRCLDMNQNPNPYLGAPQNPSYPNPVLKSPSNPSQDISNPTSDLNFRKAILSCLDRTHYIADLIGPGLAVELWCNLPPATGMQYYNATPMQTMYPFSLINARNFLLASNFKINTGTGYRYWDLNNDGVEQANEWVELKFVIRSDDTYRLKIGDAIADKLSLAAPDGCNIRVKRMYMDITGARAQWMAAKDANLYTAGWSLGVTPDSCVLWQGDAGIGTDFSYYWHPGTCYDTPYANDAQYNIASHHVEIANSYAEAETYMKIVNDRTAAAALNGPLYVNTGTEVNSRTYVGGTPGETSYVGQYWNGTIMVTGYGSDSYYGFLNMHPQNNERPAAGTIRYGFKTTDIRSFNTIYAEWVWDNNILGLVYDSLVASNPYALTSYHNLMCDNYTVGTYAHPTLGTCTAVTFHLRPGMYWSDGTPITMSDIYFTLVGMPRLLKSLGYPNPWWYSSVKEILSFAVLDPYTFQILIDVKSIWAIGLTGAGIRIQPEHIWKPIITTGDPTQAVPDKNMICSGPYRVRDYEGTATYVELVANTPGRTVQTTGSVFSGSTPITNPYGYFRYSPISVDIQESYANKFDTGTHTLTVTLKNEWLSGSLTVDKTITIKFSNGTTVTLATTTGTVIPAGGKYPESFTFKWPYGMHKVTVTYSITAPSWAVLTETKSELYYVTIKQDIAGSTFYADIGLPTYPYKSENPSPDIKVDIQDVARASGAFGSYPGHPKWSPIADITGDYKVDIQDLARISAKFGWHGA